MTLFVLFSYALVTAQTNCITNLKTSSILLDNIAPLHVKNDASPQRHLLYVPSQKQAFELIGAFTRLSFQTHSEFQCSKVCTKIAFSGTMYLGCVWKWIRSRKQNSAPESTLYAVNVIKMSTAQLFKHARQWDSYNAPETAPETLAFFNRAYLFGWSCRSESFHQFWLKSCE